MIHILLAHSHPLVRTGLRATLAVEADFQVIGEATNGGQVQHMCRDGQPDIVLLDVNMPGPLPFETIQYVRALAPELPILALTTHNNMIDIRALVAAGVAGCILKDDSPAALVRAIRAVYNGDVWFSRAIIAQLFQRHQEIQAAIDGSSLSKRELQLIEMIAYGWDNKRIAQQLDLAEQTVRNYISRLYTRVGARSRSEIVVRARMWGLVGKDSQHAENGASL